MAVGRLDSLVHGGGRAHSIEVRGRDHTLDSLDLGPVQKRVGVLDFIVQFAPTQTTLCYVTVTYSSYVMYIKEFWKL